MVKAVIKKQLRRDYPWPGNVRELEQCVRRVMLNQTYTGDIGLKSSDIGEKLKCGIDNCNIDAQDLLAGYCSLLYKRFGTYEEVSRRVKLDRRTVKKYIEKNRGGKQHRGGGY